MLQEILFWKNWNPLFKFIYLFLFTIFLISVSFFIYGFLNTQESIIPWQTVNYIDKKAFSFLNITNGIFNIPLENYTFYVTQSFKSSSLVVDFKIVNTFFVIYLISLIFLFSVITYFKSWWYYVANTLIVATIAGLRLDLFMVFGDVKNLFVIFVLITSVGLNILFHFYKTNSPFIIRLLSYFALFLVYGLIIHYGSNLPNPQLYLNNYGLFAPLFVALIFIILVSFDVEYIFLFLSTQSKSINPQSNTLNFIIISLLYLSNLVLTILKRINVIDWNLFYLDEYGVLALATIAGFVVYRRRLEATGSVIPFQPFGAIFYLILASLTWACIGYIHATGNLSLIKSLKEIILFSHFGFGLSFLIFILYNYTIYFNKNLPVYEVIFDTTNGPIHYMRIGGIIITISLITNNYNLAFDYMFAGYYSNVADVYMEEKNYPMATKYYDKAGEFKDYDFKRTIGMATIAEANDDNEAAIEQYNRLHASFDCEQAYVNEAFLYDKDGNFLKSLSILKDGLKKYPNSTHIVLNIGYIFSKTKLIDSAAYFYNIAEKQSASELQAKTNKLSLALNHSIDIDSADIDYNSTHLPYLINVLTYTNLKGNSYNQKYINTPQKEEFWMYHVNYLANINTLKDTTLLNKNSKILIANDKKDEYKENVIYANALHNFTNQKVNKAMSDIYFLKNYYSGNSSIYANTLGILSLTQKQPNKAFEYFVESYNDRNNIGGMNGLIALTDVSTYSKRFDYIEKLINNSDTSVRFLTKEIDSYSKYNAVPQSNEDKIKYLNINKKKLSSGDLLKIVNQISTKGLQLTAALIAQTELVDREEFNLAKTISLDGLNVAQMSYKANLNQLFIVLNDQKYDEILTKVDDTKLNIEDKVYKTYFKFKSYCNKNDKTNAEKLIPTLVESLPLYNPAQISICDYYTQNNQIDKAYEICSKALAINNYNTQLKKRLCLLSIPKGLGIYVETQIEELKNELSPAEFQEFKQKFDTELAKQNSVFE